MGYLTKQNIIISILFVLVLFTLQGHAATTSNSKAKIKELQKNLDAKKHLVYERLKALNDLMQLEVFNANWLEDSTIQKEYYLSQGFKKELKALMHLKQELEELNAVGPEIAEEKGISKERLYRGHAEHALQKMLSGFDIHGATLVSLKGKLAFPVTGPVIGTFGNFYNPQKSLFTFQKGITIKSAFGSPVKVVADGKTVFSGLLKNYGFIVIVEHSGQYYSLYGQLGKVFVRNGTVVKASDVVGTTSKEPFYFEIRDKNVAINPLQWFLKSSIILSKSS